MYNTKKSTLYILKINVIVSFKVWCHFLVKISEFLMNGNVANTVN